MIFGTIKTSSETVLLDHRNMVATFICIIRKINIISGKIESSPKNHIKQDAFTLRLLEIES